MSWSQLASRMAGFSPALSSTLGITSDVVFAHASAVLPRKQPDHCLDVLVGTQAAGWGAALVLVGDGPELAATLDRVHELGVVAQVVAMGYRDDAHGLLAAADVVLVPSVSEGTPRRIEAFVMAVPVVGAGIPGLVELVGDDGSPAVPYDCTALTVATVEALADRPSASRPGPRPHTWVVVR